MPLSLGYKIENNKCVPSKLYTALEYEVETSSGLAAKYTGAHADALDGSGTKNIYYYTASSDANATTILNKNNVIYGGFCWKIIRTTDTGGTKLMYNGPVSNGKCNNTGTSTLIGSQTYYYDDVVNGQPGCPTQSNNDKSLAYVGYMYNTSKLHKVTAYDNYSKFLFTGCDGGNCNTNQKATDAIADALWSDNVNVTSSSTKQRVDNWFRDNLNKNGYPDYLEDAVFCNDRRFTYSSNGFFSGTNGYFWGGDDYRLTFQTAWSTDLNCYNETDKFTTSNSKAKLTYKVAIVTAPELRLMGNNKLYLTSGAPMWTMTPNYFTATIPRMTGLFGDGSLQEAYLCRKFGIRPVVSIKYGANILSGSGTTSSPYNITLNSVD